MDAINTKTDKVNASFRLPEPLVTRIKIRAAEEHVRPCVFVERLLTDSLTRCTDEPAPVEAR